MQTLKSFGHVGQSVRISRPVCKLGLDFRRTQRVFLDVDKHSSDGHEIDHWIKQMLRCDVLRPIDPYDVKWLTRHKPVLKKDSDEKRIIGQFRSLNERTTPIPGRSQDQLAIARKTAQFEWKTKVDLTKAFYTIHVDEATQPYFALVCRGKFYTYQRMPMGISNGPAIFARYGDFIKSLLPVNKLANIEVYQDDFILYHNDRDILKDLTETLVEILKADGATINKIKSMIEPQETIPVLGYLVSDTVTIPPRLIDSTSRLLQEVLLKSRATKKELSVLVGRMKFISLRDDASIDAILKPVVNRMKALNDAKKEVTLASDEIAAIKEAAKQLLLSDKN